MKLQESTEESILRGLRDLGVPVVKLSVSIDQQRAQLTGQVNTFYALQLIQHHVPALCPGLKASIAVQVVQDPPRSPETGSVDRLPTLPLPMRYDSTKHTFLDTVRSAKQPTSRLRNRTRSRRFFEFGLDA